MATNKTSKPVIGQYLKLCKDKTCANRFKCSLYYRKSVTQTNTPKYNATIDNSGWLKVECFEYKLGV